MNKMQTFEQFLTGNTPPIDIVAFTINLLLTLVLIILVSLIYIKFGKAISNRKIFAQNLTLIALTTMLIITIVKSSLALSLGLVGALSIVRFRTPIKEPEELAYLFLSIAIGLGLGAGQRIVTFIGCAFILLVVCFRNLGSKTETPAGMHLSVSTDSPSPALLDDILVVLNKYASEVNMRRLDDSGVSFQSDFFVFFTDFSLFTKAKSELRALDKNLTISFMDNQLL